MVLSKTGSASGDKSENKTCRKREKQGIQVTLVHVIWMPVEKLLGLHLKKKKGRMQCEGGGKGERKGRRKKGREKGMCETHREGPTHAKEQPLHVATPQNRTAMGVCTPSL